MTIKEMHMMRLQEAQARKQLIKHRKLTPIAKEIELRREAMMRDILDNIPNIVAQQIAVANLPVEEEGKNNDVILKASSSLLDRVFGKAKESIDHTGTVVFSLRALSKKADEMEALELSNDSSLNNE